MMVGEGVDSDRTASVPVGRRTSASPLALAAAGAASLLLFAAAGWGLRSFRTGERARPAPTTAVATVAASPVPVPYARGRLVFRVQCARCHGAEGRGDGPDAATLRPPPRDLTAATWRAPATRENIRKAIVEGLPNSMMPRLASGLSARELESVIDYVLSLAPEGAKHPSAIGDLRALLQNAGFIPAPADRRATPVTLRGANGERVSLDHLRGKLILFVFWGTTCASCVEELPDLQDLSSRFDARGLSVVPVCADEDDATTVLRIARQRAPRLAVYVDPTGLAKLSYDVQALPTAVLISAEGRLLGRAEGARRWTTAEAEALIRSCLPRSASSPSGRPSDEHSGF